MKLIQLISFTFTIVLLLQSGVLNNTSSEFLLSDLSSVSPGQIENRQLLSSSTMIWETDENTQYIDPHVNYESLGDWIAYNVYETLYTYPWDSGATEPSVNLLAAAAPIVSSNGLNYTIELREGITFHDGTPFNASCVKWNIERAMKIFYFDGPIRTIADVLKDGVNVVSAASSGGPLSSEFETAFNSWVSTSGAIEIIDDFTTRFVLEHPYPAFIQALTCEVGSIMSPSYAIAHASSPAVASWDEYGVDFGEYDGYMSVHTCGTGPYMVVEWVPDQYIELDLFSNYWRTSTSPNSGSIEKVFIKMQYDYNGRSLSLRAAVIDGCYWPSFYADDIWDNITETSTDPDIFVSVGGCSYSNFYLGFNMGIINMSYGSVLDEKISPFHWIDFRKTASWLFDYELYLSEVLKGFGVQGKGPIPIGMLGQNSDPFRFEYNLTAAIESWNTAMLNPNFVDALNELDNSITFYYTAGSLRQELACLILVDGLIAMWDDVTADQTGLTEPMTATVQALEWSTYISSIRQNRMPVFFCSGYPDLADPDCYLFSSVFHLGTYAQRVCYNNSDVNEMYQLQKVETTLSERINLLDSIQEAVGEDVPYLWLYQSTEFRTWGAWLQGDGLIYNPMHDIYFFHLFKSGITSQTTSDGFAEALLVAISIGSIGVMLVAIVLIVRTNRWDHSTSESSY